MIPTKLVLYNFLPYRGEVLLDLRAVRVACITGDNGAGKSSLLDAITWSLWGKARGAAERDLMSLGTTEMGVDFQFVLGGQEYRVVRRRRRRGNSPDVAQLEVQTRALSPDGEGPWRAITGDTLSKTQKLLTEAIGMEYDTFINSAFILQGRADEFTTKGPTDRKQVLADILGLGQYDALEERARALRRDREAARKDAEGQIERIEQELTRRPECETDLRGTSDALVALGTVIYQVEDELAQAQAQRAALEGVRAALADAIANRDEHQVAIGRLSERIGATEQRIGALSAIIAEAEAIRAGYAELFAAQEGEAAANQQLSQYNQLIQRSHAAERAINLTRTQLLQEQHALEHEIGRLEKLRATLPELTQLHEKIAARLDESRQAEERRAILDDSIKSATEELGKRKGENEFLKSEMHQIKARQEQIDGAGAICPLCTRPLADHDRQQIHDHYQTEGVQRKEHYRANQRRIAQLEQEIATYNNELQSCELLIAEGRRLGREEGSLRQKVVDAQDARVKIASVTNDRDRFAERLAAGSFALEAHAELAEVTAAITAIGYDAAAHQQARQRLETLRPFGDRFRALERAEEEVIGRQEQLAEYRQSLRLHEERRADCIARIGELSVLMGGWDELTRKIEELGVSLQTKQRDRETLMLRQGELMAMLQRLNELEETARTLRTERNRLAEEEGAYRDLSRAFGKGGIQAMIIEAAVPELQDEANAILANMPGNSMRVEFHTQRETRKGDTVEALDIRIGDEAGQRDYALYSGGESFRINFAIRVALAKLLARRAGARLQLLVIDEGFGTQDARGRDSLVEAIRSIENDFETILVITHVNELKDLFPTQIMVEKGPQGSSLSVV